MDFSKADFSIVISSVWLPDKENHKRKASLTNRANLKIVRTVESWNCDAIVGYSILNRSFLV
jgi:hypothetical protein